MPENEVLVFSLLPGFESARHSCLGPFWYGALMRRPPQAPASELAPAAASPRSTLAVAIAALFALGVVNGALGPLLPHLSDRVGVPAERLGAIFTTLFLGALLLQVAGGWLNERIGLRRMVVIGLALLAASVVGLGASPTLPALLVCALLAGTGQGALDASTNVLVPAVFGERSVSAVNLLHFAFGAGAVLAPVMMSGATSAWGSPLPVLWMAAGLGALAALATARWAMDPRVARPHESGAPARLYTRPALWLLSLLLFLGVAVEMGTGGWTTVYADRTTELSPGAVAMLTSGFWLALMCGRALGAAFGHRLRSRQLAMLAIATTCLGSAMLVLGSGSMGWTVAGTLATGLGVGPIFPTAVVIATELFPSAPSRAVSVVIAVSSLGGMSLPWLQGRLLGAAPLASVALVAAECGLMLVLFLAVRRVSSGGSSPAPESARSR